MFDHGSMTVPASWLVAEQEMGSWRVHFPQAERRCCAVRPWLASNSEDGGLEHHRQSADLFRREEIDICKMHENELLSKDKKRSVRQKT